jgi:hypothetical protein
MVHSASAAAQNISVSAGLAFTALCLTFGGSTNPPSWTLFSETVTNLANEITQCDEWDPSALHRPAQPVAPTPVRLPDSIPIALASPLGVVPLPVPRGRIDGFIDDLINVFPDTEENCSRLPHVVPLAIHATSRPHAKTIPSPLLADLSYPMRSSSLRVPPWRSKLSLAGNSTVGVCWQLSQATNSIPGRQISTP